MRQPATPLRTLLLTLALPLAARAQAEFRPGYIVPVAGDTVRGEVDLRDPYFNHTQCRFRLGPAAEARTYRPAELRAYGVPAAGKAYRAIVPPPGPAAYFGQVLVSGPASLYQLRDADRADHYYLDAPQFALAELMYRPELVPGQTVLRDDPRYRLTLQQALPNCPAAEALLPRLPFREEALRRVVTAFNACQGVVVAAPLRPRPPLRLGVLVGGQLISTHLTYQAGSPTQSVRLDLPSQGGLLLGVRLGVPLASLSRRLALEVDLSYSHQHYADATGSNASFGSTRQSYSFTLDYLRLPLLLRYTPGGGALRPVLELGPTLAYALRLDTNVTTVDYYNRTTSGDFLPDNQRRLQEGLLAGAGVTFPYWQTRRAALLARAEADTGWLGGGVESGAGRFYLLLALDLTQ